MALSKKEKKGKNALPGEPKARFREQAGIRLGQALQKIALVGKCATAKNEWTEAQVDYIREQLDAAVKETVKRFSIKPETKTAKKIEIPF